MYGSSLTTVLIRLSHNERGFVAAESLLEYQRSPSPIMYKERECVEQLELEAGITETDEAVLVNREFIGLMSSDG